MFTRSLLAASLAGLAAAAPAPRAEDINTFSMIAVHSGNEAVHLRGLSFTEEKWWLGKNTTTYCPNTSCGSSTNAAVASFSPSTSDLALHVQVPGGQLTYVQPDGQVGYTPAHTAYMPDGSLVTPFNYTPQATPNSVGNLKFDGKDFFACPVGEQYIYQIYADVPGFTKTDCIGIAVGTAEWTQEGEAWQYA